MPTFVWFVAFVAAGFGILGFVSALANEAQHETGLHQLKKQVIELRCVYLRKMIDAFGLTEPDDSIEVMIADELGPESPPIEESEFDEEYEPAAAA